MDDTKPSPFPISRFDRTVFAVLAMAVILLALLAWQSGRAAVGSSAPRVLYMTVDDQGRNQLHLATLTPEYTVAETRSLTASESGIWDYAATPDGERSVYSALSELGLSDLWTVSLATGRRQRLLVCPDASCSNARYAPDGRLIAHTQRTMSDFASAFFSPPRLRLLDEATGETAPVFPDSQKLAFEPRWSADGAWLSYISPDPQGVGVINLQDGREAIYPNAMGEPGEWSATGTTLLTTETWQQGEEYVTHLLRVDVASDEVVDLSGEETLVNDSGARYSPDGEWIAFRRKVLTGPDASRGKQIWLMRADGSQARPLTADVDFDYGDPSWSPDGRYLLTRRFSLLGTEIIPSIWLIDVETGDLRELLTPGDQPSWVP